MNFFFFFFFLLFFFLLIFCKKKSVAILDFRLKFPKCVSELLIRQNAISQCNESGIQFADLTVLGHISHSGTATVIILCSEIFFSILKER